MNKEDISILLQKSKSFMTMAEICDFMTRSDDITEQDVQEAVTHSIRGSLVKAFSRAGSPDTFYADRRLYTTGRYEGRGDFQPVHYHDVTTTPNGRSTLIVGNKLFSLTAAETKGLNALLKREDHSTLPTMKDLSEESGVKRTSLHRLIHGGYDTGLFKIYKQPGSKREYYAAFSDDLPVTVGEQYERIL